MCTSTCHIRLIPVLLFFFIIQACKQAPSSAVTVTGQVLDEKTNKPVPGINIRLEAVLSSAKDTQLTAAVTDKEGKYTITISRGIIDRYTDTANTSYQKAALRLVAEPVQAQQQQQYKNPYKTGPKRTPFLFFSQVVLPNNTLRQSDIVQDIKMQAGAIIICHSQLTDTNANIFLDVSGLQKPKDHFRIIVNKDRYLIVRPDHPYLLNIVHELPGMDSIAAEQIIKQDTVRLKPMDTLAVNISTEMLQLPVNR
ncbi:MAG TPA: hypothetical protein VGE90_06695 [Chitinophaga sp.]